MPDGIFAPAFSRAGAVRTFGLIFYVSRFNPNVNIYTKKLVKLTIKNFIFFIDLFNNIVYDICITEFYSVSLYPFMYAKFPLV